MEKSNLLFRELNYITFFTTNSKIYHHSLLKKLPCIYKYFLSKSKILISIILEKLSGRTVLLGLLVLSKTKK